METSGSFKLFKNMSNKILVTLNYSWADEFDIPAMWITSVEEFKKFKKELSELDISEYNEIYFGTNEYVSFSSYSDIINNLIVTNITEQFYEEFLETVGESFGLISIPDLLDSYYPLD
jgi:hypothetical protein